MLTASSEPCIGTDRQVASISRENHAFCAGRADLLPDYSVKERLKRQHAKIRLRNVVPYGNLALNRPSLGGHLGNVGLEIPPLTFILRKANRGSGRCGSLREVFDPA